MNYETIRKYDVSNGEGVRTTIFCTGCEHYCKGCFNEDLWNFDSGKLFTYYELETLMKNLRDENVVGINILGGEPLHPKNINTITAICYSSKVNCPDKTIWLWSGYKLEELVERKDTKNILELVDVLVDGKFELENRDINLKYRGSSNQRVIDMIKTREQKKIVLMEV